MVKIRNLSEIKTELLNKGFKEYSRLVPGDLIGHPETEHFIAWYKNGKRKGNSAPLFGIQESFGYIVLFQNQSYIYRGVPNALVNLIKELDYRGLLEYTEEGEL